MWTGTCVLVVQWVLTNIDMYLCLSGAVWTQGRGHAPHSPSIAFRHQLEEGCRNPVLGVCMYLYLSGAVGIRARGRVLVTL